jgi:hypothetical protein
MEHKASCIKTGVLKASLFYYAGLITTAIFHLIVGWPNRYAPPLSILVAISFLLIGILWSALNLTDIRHLRLRLESVGALIVHSVVLLISFTCIYTLFQTTEV